MIETNILSIVSLEDVADIRVSNVDKKALPNEPKVMLCNYMDVYSNDYIRADLDFMAASASFAEVEKFKVEDGDVLITKDSETPFDIGISSVVTESIENLVCGYHLALLKPYKNIIDPVYLCKQLGSDHVAKYYLKNASGSTRYGLSNGAIARTPIPLLPLSQQQKIAKILTTIDQLIEKTQALIDKHTAIKQGMMADLFTRGIDLTTGQLRPPVEQAPHLYKETELGWIPKDWDVITITDFASDEKNAIVDGPFGSNLKTEHYRPTGIPVIQSGFVTSNIFMADQYLYVDKKKFYSEIRSKVGPGDIVMAKIGAQCGRCAIMPENHQVGILAGNSLKITVAKHNFNEYLEALLHYFQRIGKLDVITSTTAQPAISMSSLKKMHMQYAQPSEQKQIVNMLSITETHISKDVSQLCKLKELKSGLMQDLLTGKVSV